MHLEIIDIKEFEGGGTLIGERIPYSNGDHKKPRGTVYNGPALPKIFIQIDPNDLETFQLNYSQKPSTFYKKYVLPLVFSTAKIKGLTKTLKFKSAFLIPTIYRWNKYGGGRDYIKGQLKEREPCFLQVRGKENYKYDLNVVVKLITIEGADKCTLNQTMSFESVENRNKRLIQEKEDKRIKEERIKIEQDREKGQEIFDIGDKIFESFRNLHADELEKIFIQLNSQSGLSISRLLIKALALNGKIVKSKSKLEHVGKKSAIEAFEKNKDRFRFENQTIDYRNIQKMYL